MIDDKSSIFDQLRQIEREVVEGERRLAEQEHLIVELRREGQDTERAEQELETLRKDERLRNQDRQRLLSMLQP